MSIGRLHLGPATLPLFGAQRREQPVLSGGRQVARSISIDCRCEVSGSTPAALATALSNTAGHRQSGQTVKIEFNGVDELVISAGDCADGGPHVTIAPGNGLGLGQRVVTVSIAATLIFTPAQLQGGATGHAWEESISTRDDGRLVITRAGEIVAAGATGAFNAIATAFAAAYPATAWVVTRNTRANASGDRLAWQLQAEQQAQTIPGGAGVVRGTVVTTNSRRDNRSTRRRSFNYALTPAANTAAILAAIRASNATTTYISESESITTGAQHTLQAEYEFFTTQASGYKRSIELVAPVDVFEPVLFPGQSPVMRKRPPEPYLLFDSGEISSRSHMYGPAPELVNVDGINVVYVERPTLAHSSSGSGSEITTRWRRAYAITSPPNSDTLYTLAMDTPQITAVARPGESQNPGGQA